MIVGVDVASMLLGGVAAGMVLFIVSVGLSVTMGLMGFVNLAHGGFAMLGGYAIVLAMKHWGLGFAPALLFGFLAVAAVSAVLERLLYARLYNAGELDQVLFTIGLVFMAVTAVDWAMGSSQQNIKLPAWLQGRREILGVQVGIYRSFIIVICGTLAIGLQLALMRTRFGSRLRAAVDDARVARGLGIPVGTVFAVTFAMGSGLAGLGGALGAELLGLDPNFPLKFMIYFLIVVTVGGTSGITGPFVASLLLGVADIAGKYYVPALGAFMIYLVMIVVLVLRPHGLFARAR